MIGKAFDPKFKYGNFPRNHASESFMLFGTTILKNFMGDGRVRKIRRHKKYDEIWVQFGYFQHKKWLVAIFPPVRQMIGTLQEGDNIHVYGTVDRWGERRAYVIYAFLKFPMPSIRQVEDYSVDMELYKIQQTDEEKEINSHIANMVNQKNFTGREFFAEGNKSDDDVYVSNNLDDEETK